MDRIKQQALHRNVAETLQLVVEGVMLSDWRAVTKEQIVQEIARLRSVKAQYISTHFTHQLTMREEVLSPLDQALLTLYLLLDTLEGRDLDQQRAIYHALLEAQTPLLLACTIVPIEEEVVKDADHLSTVPLVPVVEHVGLEEVQAPDLTLPSPESSIASHKKESSSNNWFRWTEEREQQLIAAITQLVGGLDHLDQVNQAIMKQIATQYDWPVRSIEYKVRQLRLRQVPRHNEEQREEAAPEQEDDRRTTLVSAQ
jgi:hypothetical protein